MNADGTGLTSLTNLTNSVDDWSYGHWYSVWSPDGDKLALRARHNENWDVYTVNADGTGLTNISNHPDPDMNPAWSPDGSRIAFVSKRSGNWDIYVVNADGSGLINVSNHPAADMGFPAWAPAGD